jgi:hypothetical protein
MTINTGGRGQTGIMPGNAQVKCPLIISGQVRQLIEMVRAVAALRTESEAVEWLDGLMAHARDSISVSRD